MITLPIPNVKKAFCVDSAIEYNRRAMTRALTLWHLQSLDQERDEKLHRADQIAHSLTNDAKLAAARTARDVETNRLALLHGEMKDAELQAKSLDSKIKDLEARLSSGRVTNPKELDSLEKDRQMHLRHRGELDTKLLELMDAIERTQADTDGKDAAFKKAQAVSSNDAQKLERERAALTARIAEIGAESARLRAALDSGVTATYDRLRQSKARRAVARLKNNGCGVCGMQIPSGLRSRVEDDEDLVFCPDCGRILAT